MTSVIGNQQQCIFKNPTTFTTYIGTVHLKLNKFDFLNSISSILFDNALEQAIKHISHTHGLLTNFYYFPFDLYTLSHSI